MLLCLCRNHSWPHDVGWWDERGTGLCVIFLASHGLLRLLDCWRRPGSFHPGYLSWWLHSIHPIIEGGLWLDWGNKCTFCSWSTRSTVAILSSLSRSKIPWVNPGEGENSLDFAFTMQHKNTHVLYSQTPVATTTSITPTLFQSLVIYPSILFNIDTRGFPPTKVGAILGESTGQAWSYAWLCDTNIQLGTHSCAVGTMLDNCMYINIGTECQCQTWHWPHLFATFTFCLASNVKAGRQNI